MAKKHALILSTIEGHASIAQALHETLSSQDWSTYTLNYPDPLLKIYRILYRKMPQGMSLFYQLSSNRTIENMAKLYLRSSYKSLLFSTLEEQKPDIILSVNYGFDPCIEYFRHDIAIPYINIMPDPRTFLSISLSTTADMNCIFDTTQKQDCAVLKPTAKTTISGWFVRKAFTAVSTKQQQTIRKELGLQPDMLTILFTTGYEGTETVANLLPKLSKTIKPFQIVIACGTNTLLLSRMQELARQNKNEAVSLIPLPFTKQLHKYMQACDLVVGKAGPNTIFEAVATHSPFFATTHIGGLEDGNLSVIREYKLGFVEEWDMQIIDKLQDIIHEPTVLDQFKKPIQALAEINNQSRQKLLKVISDLTKK